MPPDRFRFVLVALVALSAPCAGALQGAPTQSPTIEKLNGFLDRVEQFGFSGSVVVARRGELLAERHMGLARREPRRPVDSSTLFSVASITKQFTAAAVLQLESQGRLRLDDPMGRFFEGAPAAKRGITIRQLLTHAAGLPFQCGSTPVPTREQFLACLWETPLVAEPGKRTEYSNAGYALLTAVIESVTGDSYQQVLGRLFAAAEMGDTGFESQVGRWSETRLAHQYTWRVDHGHLVRADVDWNLRGSADAITTVGDLHRWIVALTTDKVLPASLRHRLLAGGYGWEPEHSLLKARGLQTLGFNALVALQPDEGLSWIVLSNTCYGLHTPTPFVDQGIEGILTNRAFVQPPEVGQKVSGFDLTGAYRGPDDSELRVEQQDGNLSVAAVGQVAVEHLLGADRTTARRLAESNQRTARVMDSIERDDYAAAQSAMSRDDWTQFRLAFRDWTVRMQSRSGAYRGHRVLGTIPQGSGERSYVELEFEQARLVRRLRWTGGRLTSFIGGAAPLLETRFVPREAGGFVGFHLTYTNPIRLSVIRSGDSLRIRLGSSPPFARVSRR